MGIKQEKLSDVAEIKRGNRITKNDLVENGKYKVISGGEGFLGFYNDFNRNANTITIAQYGSAGYVNFQTEYFWANDVCYSVFPYDCINNKFLYYSIKNQQDLLYKLRTNAVPSCLPIEKLSSIKIFLPPLFIQEKIVEILDKLEMLSCKEQEGLKLNIKQQQKKYEFYRDNLLKFKEKKREN